MPTYEITDREGLKALIAAPNKKVLEDWALRDGALDSYYKVLECPHHTKPNLEIAGEYPDITKLADEQLHQIATDSMRRRHYGRTNTLRKMMLINDGMPIQDAVQMVERELDQRERDRETLITVSPNVIEILDASPIDDALKFKTRIEEDFTRRNGHPMKLNWEPKQLRHNECQQINNSAPRMLEFTKDEKEMFSRLRESPPKRKKKGALFWGFVIVTLIILAAIIF